MKYYFLSNSINRKLIGRYPQSESLSTESNIFTFKQHEEITKDSILPEPILHVRSKLTAYIDSIPINKFWFLILRNDFIRFLKTYKINNFQYWGLTVYKNKKSIDNYSLFHVHESYQEKYVDYKKSNFHVKKIGDNNSKKTVNINSYEEYCNLLEFLREEDQNLMMYSEKLVLDFNKATDDIFRLDNLPCLGIGYYVSERLKNAIEEGGFTGMEFSEIEEKYKHIKIMY